jgi:type II secretory pathway pseudopilin PulG
MTNDEARRSDKIRIIRSRRRSRLRHSGFVINSSFVIRHSSFACRLSRRYPTKARSTLRHAESAFTIIELLVVIIIIFILVGLVLSISSYVQNKGARARAETEIAAISAALESYKADNGIYPANNSLDPTTMTDPSSYVSASNYLYIQLSGDSDGNPTTTGSSDTRNYFGGSLKQSMLSPNPPGANTYLRDPFRNSYGYSTSKNPIANPTGYTTAGGYNPTFDLWSTAGTGTSGPPSPSPIQNIWIKNW